MKPMRIVIFAKAPIAGFAKSRLIPVLGAQGAPDLAKRLLVYTLDQALSAGVGHVELCVTPPKQHDAWQTIAVPDQVIWSEQGEGDLGARMARAARRVIDGGEAILLMGTDCPQLDCEQLRAAAQALLTADTTLVPTADGGFALLGLNRFHPSVFEGIEWSTDTVAFETLCRIGQLGWSVMNQPMLHDIDEPQDLKWLPTGWLEALHA